MDIATFAFISLALFMVHEFEEIIFVRRWVEQGANNPRLKNDVWIKGRSHYPSTPTIALMIAEEFIIACGVLLIAILVPFPELAMAILTGHALHLVAGHLLPAVRFRRWTPGSVTAAATLPIICVVAIIFAATAPLNWLLVVLVLIPVMLLIVLNLKLLYRNADRIERLIQRAYRSRSIPRAAP